MIPTRVGKSKPLSSWKGPSLPLPSEKDRFIPPDKTPPASSAHTLDPNTVTVALPPDFVVLAGTIFQLTPEEIRLAKRNSDDPALLHSLDMALTRLLFDDAAVTVSGTGTGQTKGQDKHSQITDVLRVGGYSRFNRWHVSSLERLIAMCFVCIVTNKWREFAGTCFCE